MNTCPGGLNHEREDILKAVLELSNRHDADPIQAYLADDMRFRNPITGDTDASDLHAVHSAIFAGFPDIEYRMERMLSQADSVVVESTVVGTHQGEFAGMPATARSMNLHVALVTDWRSYFDTATLLRRVGALPTPAEAAPASPQGGAAFGVQPAWRETACSR